MHPRPPVVTILGHVDHGKTTLLDSIRKSRLAEKEHGGITQRIGGYEIETNIKGYHTNKITFIDTPGHEAFSLLRARGTTVADIVIDAKDSIMPQTAESITHIKTANIPFIVTINKIDLPEANPEKVKRDLLKYQIQVEGKGGGVPTAEISAKTGKGIRELLETILLMASDLNLRYSESAVAHATIIETKKDKRGIVVSAVIKDGKLSVGDEIESEGKTAKVRSLFDDQGIPVKYVLPAKPFELLGFSELPQVGSLIMHRSDFKRKPAVEKTPPQTVPSQALTMEAILHPKKEEKKLSLIIKADSQGSLEAINNSLMGNQDIKIILTGVGDIYKSDVFLAKTTQSIIIGFAVNTPEEVKQLAKQEKIIIKTYNIIYHLLEELNEVASLLTEKKQQEKNLKGEAKVLASFIIEGERVFGVKVLKGKLNLGDQLELHRSSKMIGKTKLVSLKIRAKRVNEVKKDQEAGMILGPPLDIIVGDVLKSIL